MTAVLLTGGTGSFGNAMTRFLLNQDVERVVILSRDELKQSEMAQRFGDPRVRYFLGDVRDRGRLRRAFHGIDIVIHAAALKQVPACEYNPFEAVQTNILGAQNVIDAALDTGVQRVLALSTDKACAPLNLYGCTKATAEKLFIAGNAYRGSASGPLFSCLRYGNVAGSRGSVIPVWAAFIKDRRPLPVTDPAMTRFWFTLDRATRFAWRCLQDMAGGELYVPRIPSFYIEHLAHAMAGPTYPLEIVGIRGGEKLHESMISADEAPFFVEAGDLYLRRGHERPALAGTVKPYTSDSNERWFGVEELTKELEGLCGAA